MSLKIKLSCFLQQYRGLFFGLAVALTAAILLATSFLMATKTTAEIATQQDWLGLFVVGSPVDGDRFANPQIDPPISWVYTGNTDLAGNQASGNCWTSKTGNPPRGSTKPWLVGKCPFNPPLQSGAYEFRLYANDEQSAEAWLAQSKSIWLPFNAGFNTTCNRTDWTATANIIVPPMVGVSSYNFYKKIGAEAWPLNPTSSLPASSTQDVTYSESGLTKDETYSYRVVAVSKRPYDADTNPSAYKEATNASLSNPLSFIACSIPWLKTSGGDVHSNK